MKRMFSCWLSVILCLSCMIVLLVPCASIAASCEQWVAKAVSVQGSVEARKVGETQWQKVELNDTFCPGDKIRVNDRSRAGLSLVNQPLLRLDQNTTITLGGIKQKKTSVVELARGAVHFFSRIRRNLEVITGFVNAGVEGTEGFIRVETDRTFISIFEGQVLASNTAGSLTLTSGQSAVAEAGKAPVLRVVVRPRDAVHWALYYLPVLFVSPGTAPKENPADPRFLAYRASQLLAVGRVDEANTDIQRALSLDPGFSDAHALQAIIFVVQSERDKALDSAQKAVKTGPGSATARIALSYAQQAGFDLDGARTSIEEALKLIPDNALAWARLAELWSSFGRLGKALEAAKKAVDLEPNLSRTQMVLGFAYLTQVRTTASREAFEKAIALDQADPLARLGLGLAIIRDGDLTAGGRQIEIAASLDPNNSLVRSYLGKVYFEKKNIGLDEREFAIAKELDPNDPTPWFYDAIAKQTTNRPVEALHNLQKARELNDNRAVYRSKLLLDSDEAARSASIARIYNDLNFQQRALFEGWMSVNTDPTSFPPIGFWPIPMRPCPAARSPGSVSCCNPSCCSPSTSHRSSRAWPRATCFSSAPAARPTCRSPSSIRSLTATASLSRAVACWPETTPRPPRGSFPGSTKGSPSAAATRISTPTGGGTTPTRGIKSPMLSPSTRSPPGPVYRPSTASAILKKATFN